MTLVSDVTPFLQAADFKISELALVVAQQADAISTRDATIASLRAQLAALTPPPPPVASNGFTTYPAGWTRTLFADDFTGDLSKWNVRNTTDLTKPNSQDNMDGVNFARNCTVKDSVLSIRTGADSGVTAKPWSCGYLDTKGGKFSVEDGLFEARLRFPWGPNATGFWPAFWLRPDDSGDGELDGMEAWPAKNELGFTIHHDYRASSDPLHVGQVAYRLPLPLAIDPTQWHVYSIQKEKDALKFWIDGQVVKDMTSVAWRAGTLERAVKWHLRLNLQIGGSWGGKPNAQTDLTKTYDIDWVRVLGR